MNKRKYPYNIDMCPQLKIHIGEKQLANGILGPLKMSDVYEKTQQLLFQGAKVSFESIAQPALVDQILCDSKPLKQLQLTSNGKLFNPEFTIKSSKIDDNQQKCNFCSQTVNLDVCGKCGDTFCNMCSLSVCSDEVNKMCFTCYK